MKEKGGKLVNLVTPADPVEVFEADEADPGKAAKAKADQIAKKSGKYGEQKIKPFKPNTDEAKGAANKSTGENKEKSETSWVEIALLDESGNPAAGVEYAITLPDGSVAKGSTDAKGKAKVEGFEPGKCELTLPKVHKDAW